MGAGKRAVWLIIGFLAVLTFVAEVSMVEASVMQIMLCVAALAVACFAYFKQREDGKTLRPIKPPRKSRRRSQSLTD
jgi:CDP-diglyceride synthetase